MRFQQLKEILDHMIDSRSAMSQLYRRMTGQADSPRAKMLLEYMVIHEKEVIEKLSNYQDEASPRVLDTWFENVQGEDFTLLCQKIELPATMTEQDVLGMALDLENRLLDVLHAALEVAPTQDVKSAIESLLQAERVRQQRFVHSTMRMDDM
ncbi:conserved hypothetical protein [Ferrimonas balearica DSM 9799]|uniref:Uncharacterized protein n=1 Tax=Ferrimonas balearica (strain DSM 9799 / CCM 4581 / KCTC 23876 / PAT) TaxID=550540 RepID=E1SPQ9_FERBD|nr:hypothetical protein [Ferrimonas balearica]MBY6018679.1 hypothetical protein [Halomonas denitrificans]ADN74723.1 conserved hypothetical protein [Ferrimonas balearica DSM 9799]MBW3140514.1 hypothetical protein [Ferrimonas balearica]MBW3165492.1 hypothetical protein [Ferrimonas balearica]MBY6095878.1 hypothetical protein [Ferrimonas balearica]